MSTVFFPDFFVDTQGPFLGVFPSHQFCVAISSTNLTIKHTQIKDEILRFQKLDSL